MSDRLREGVARRVAELRAAAGLTQKELGERAGLSRGYVARVESKAENLTLIMLNRLAVGLDVQPADLLTGLAADPTALTDRLSKADEVEDPLSKLPSRQ